MRTCVSELFFRTEIYKCNIFNDLWVLVHAWLHGVGTESAFNRTRTNVFVRFACNEVGGLLNSREIFE